MAFFMEYDDLSTNKRLPPPPSERAKKEENCVLMKLTTFLTL